MTYFDKKQDVYHIELTPHGRYLLSIGKLNFKSYAFFDDDVIYDVSRMGVSEGQNQIKERIQQNTPYSKHNGNYYGVDTNFNMMETQQVFRKEERGQIKYEAFHYLKDSIGTNDFKNEKTTNFKVDFLNNEMLSFSNVNTPSPTLEGQYSYVPQVNLEIEYKTRRGNVSETPEASSGLNNVVLSSVFSDGSYIDVVEEDVIIQVQELNSEFLAENFRLEVFIEETKKHPVPGIAQTKYYRPLVFSNQVHKIVDGMLLSDQQIQEQQDDISAQVVDENFVEYYFELNVDKEIASEEICALINQIKERNFHISDDFKCEDLEPGAGLDIYSSNIGPDDLEDC